MFGGLFSRKPNPEELAQMSEKYHGLIPFNPQKAPAITEVITVKMETDAGDITIEVYPQAAPNAAKRFVELVKCGFYDGTPIFRVVNRPRPFVAQFGINWRPDQRKWQHDNFNDDPSLFELGMGTLAFAKAGPNTNSTQIFINYADNSFLRDNGGFSTFARVTEGYEIAAQFKSVGSPDMGLDQGQLWNNGQAYLDSLKQKPNMILKAYVM